MYGGGIGPEVQLCSISWSKLSTSQSRGRSDVQKIDIFRCLFRSPQGCRSGIIHSGNDAPRKNRVEFEVGGHTLRLCILYTNDNGMEVA